MTLTEAKEQIARDNNYKDWDSLLLKADINEMYMCLTIASNLVLSSKDKEIESLKSDSKDWHDSYQASLKEIAELKGQVKNLEEWQQVKEREADAEALSIALADAEMELKETHSKEVAALNQRIDDLKSGKYIADLESELSQLKEENKNVHNLLNQSVNKIQSLQEEIQNEQEAHIKTLQQHTGELKKAQKIIMDLSEEMKKKEEEINQLKCTHEVFNMSACVACGFKRINKNEID